MITVILIVCENESTPFNNKGQPNKKEWFTKQVNWPCPPPVGGAIRVGVTKAGERMDVEASVTYVSFVADGTIDVGATIKQCRDEYANVLEEVENDGFERS